MSCWYLPNSSKELELCNNISKKKGLAKCLEIKCIATGCNFIYSTYTSTRVSKTNQAGQNPFDINARSIISCCEIYHCCEKLHHWRKEINFVQKLSWCKYQSDIVNGTATYKHKPGIHTTLRKLLKPVFKNLSINELLSTCLHGKTQNNNKVFEHYYFEKMSKIYICWPYNIEHGCIICSNKS